ncbi:IPT/TIG domain-containing protein [Candidatus Saccharibacteria bacterium]|nr:IPT/TIG domain-containing protein [Candidatus Saccharibacteria bacterium]
MRTTNKISTRLPFFAAIGVMAVFSIQAVILNMVNPIETATALSITSITPNIGSIDGGELVTITGDFGIPTDVPLDIVQMVSGDFHTLILDSSGQIFAWGSNAFGQLGNGTTTASNVPVAVDMSGVLAGRDIIQIAAGSNHSLALDSEGRVFAWGMNVWGQLGNSTGTTTASNTPVAVDMSGALHGRSIVQIEAGETHSLALDSEGQIFAWGNNWEFQLGIYLSDTYTTPVAVDTTGVLAGRTIVQIVAGDNHTLALDSEGQIFAWGMSLDGQIGSGETTSMLTPVAVDTTGVLAGRTIVQVLADGNLSFAIDDTGNMFAWGTNWAGQFGNGGDFLNSNVPVEVDITGVLAGRNITQIAINGTYVLALDDAGNMFAWGENWAGQFGNGTNIDSGIPVKTGALADRAITQIIIGFGFSSSFALDSEGNLFAWGDNSSGQFGNGTNTSSFVPVHITNFGQGLIDSLDLSVTMGGSPCTDVRVINLTTITCTTPAHPAGVVDVTVRTLHGSVTLYQSYTFVDIPEVPDTGGPGVPNTGHLRVEN